MKTPQEIASKIMMDNHFVEEFTQPQVEADISAAIQAERDEHAAREKELETLLDQAYCSLGANDTRARDAEWQVQELRDGLEAATNLRLDDDMCVWCGALSNAPHFEDCRQAQARAVLAKTGTAENKSEKSGDQ